ncbi:hypothetical protein [Shewanella xiamenensis]|uniref:hypothetical protein n=1 Tax=Shewanella xiamenensis TaxID=332186 RepID=UPI00313D2595
MLNLIKSVGFDFVFKTLALILSFIQVPLLIDALGKDFYGFWVLLFSIIQWMILFDFGIGNGLRNIIPNLVAKGQIDRISSYLYTSTFLLFIISVIGLAITFIFIKFLDYSWFGLITEPDWFLNVLYVFAILFYVFLSLSIIKPIAYIIHKPYLLSFMSLIQSVFILGTILILKDTSDTVGSLMIVLLLVCIFSNVLGSVIICFYAANHFKHLFVGDFVFSKLAMIDILKRSFDLFVLQLVFLGTYCIDNFMVANYYSAADVTEYSIAVKVYSMYTFFIGIIISPLWNKFLEFISDGNFDNAKSLVYLYLKIYIASVPLLLLSIYFVDYIVIFWVGHNVITNLNYLPFALFYMTLGLGMINSAILNALEIVKIQWVLGLLVVLFKISLFPLFSSFSSNPQSSDLMWFSFILLFPVTIFMFILMNLKLREVNKYT